MFRRVVQLEVEIEPDVGIFGAGQKVEEIDETRHGLVRLAEGSDGRQVGPGAGADVLVDAEATFQGPVVGDDHDPVGREMEVGLDGVGPRGDCGGEGGHGILRVESLEAAVGDGLWKATLRIIRGRGKVGSRPWCYYSISWRWSCAGVRIYPPTMR